MVERPPQLVPLKRRVACRLLRRLFCTVSRRPPCLSVKRGSRPSNIPLSGATNSPRRRYRYILVFDRYFWTVPAFRFLTYRTCARFRRLRWQNNLDNLGSLMQDVSLDVTSWEETDASLKTKWRFRCVLGLPWTPTLAAAGVSHRLLLAATTCCIVT